MKSKTSKRRPARITPEEKAMVKALDHLFTKGLWNFPDDFIAGRLTTRIKELEKRVAQLEGRRETTRFNVLENI